MGLVNFLYRCPDCGHDPMEGTGDEAHCTACGVRYSRNEAGITVLRDGGDGVTAPIPASSLTAAIEAQGGPFPRAGDPAGAVRYGADAVSRTSGPEAPVWYGPHLLGFAEEPGVKRPGHLEVTERGLTLTYPNGQSEAWDFLDLTAVQTSSSSVQISANNGAVVQFKFPSDSSRRWEELLRLLVQRRWREEGRGEVVEFQPRISLACARPASQAPTTPHPNRPVPVSGPRLPRSRAPWYGFFRRLVWGIMHSIARIKVEGRENLPSSGAFILIFNHQSILDPLLAQCHCTRPVFSMTKSTQFAHPVFRWLVPRVGGFPVRRYRVDPQCIRTALRFLGEGKIVGIYPEGERSWDGRIQSLRRGTLRFILKAGVPVVPCGIQGSFDVWPRWGEGPRRADVVIRFGTPLEFGPHDDRLEREAALPAASATVTSVLQDLSGETRRTGQAGP